MRHRSASSRSLTGLAIAAVFALAVSLVGAGPASPAIAAIDEDVIAPAVARIVTVDTTVRAEPSHSAAAVGSLSAGEQVSVSAKVPSWRKVTVDGAEGWVPYSVTQKVPRSLTKLTPRELTVDVVLRAQPSTKAAARATVLKHSFARATAVAGSWRKIETANGTGWVPASAIDRVSIEPRAYAATVALNVRASASGASDVVLVLKKGERVHILGTRGTWSSVKVASSSYRSGWTATKNLVRSDLRVTKTALNLRTKAWTGKVLTVIPKGAEVTLTGALVSSTTKTPRTWRKVVYGKYTGWVAVAYLTLPY